jgi:hypothetical protein
VCDVDLRRGLGEMARARALNEFAAESMCRAARRVYQEVCPDLFPLEPAETPVMSLQ